MERLVKQLHLKCLKGSEYASDITRVLYKNTKNLCFVLENLVYLIKFVLGKSIELK